MNDMALTDMTSFLERHDHWSRRVRLAMISASFAVSAILLVYGMRTLGSLAALGKLWFPIVAYPLFTAAFWTGIALWARTRPKPPGGRFLMNADDARNVARVANVGFIFVLGLAAVTIASQVGTALEISGTLKSLGATGEWVGRTILVALGALSIYFGNAWPRMPTPRAGDQKPATQTRYKRLGGWWCVIVGLGMALPALLLPIPQMIYAIVVTSAVTLVVSVIGVLMYRSAMNSPSAS
jgi:hypothetical protein